MNDKLLDIYEKECNRLEKSDIKSYNFDGPLLMYCWEEEYLNSEYKMLFLGQESNGWMGDLHLEAKDCLKTYKDFELCEYGRYTPFWQYIYETKNILMPDTIGQKNFLWSNVSKFSTLDGGPIDLESYKFFCDNFQVLEKEIEIVKPDVIIFFTGHGWDDKIQYQINEKINFNKLVDEIPADELAQLSSKSLPFHTYRVSHPRYLQLKKNWNYMVKIMENIKTK